MTCASLVVWVTGRFVGGRTRKHTRKCAFARLASGPSLPFTPPPPPKKTACREDARFLWKRLPPEAQAARPARAAFALLQAAWARDLEGTAAAAAALAPVVGAEGGAAAGLVGPVRAALRHRADRVVARAYTRLSADRLAGLLGCGSAEEAAGVARACGWTVGPDGVVSGLAAPPPPPPPHAAGGAGAAGRRDAATAAGHTVDLLDAFVDYVVELEA
jgi:hypothetical protein